MYKKILSMALSLTILFVGIFDNFDVHAASVAVGAGIVVGGETVIGVATAVVAGVTGAIGAVKLMEEHHKRGTTNKAKESKHQKGKARRQADQGGEKGDAHRTRYRKQ